MPLLFRRLGPLWPLLTILATHADAGPRDPGRVLTLEEAVEEALERNLGMVARRHDLPIVETELTTARLRPNPILSVEAEQLGIPQTGFTGLGEVGTPEYIARLEIDLERGGKRSRRVELAQASREVVRLEVLDSVRELIFNVYTAGVDILLTKEKLELARENLAAMNEIVRINEARVRTGDLARVELLRSRLEARQFGNEVRRREAELRAALEHFGFLLGREQGEAPVDLVGELRRENEPPDIDRLRRLAEERRPDLRALLRARERSEADLRLQVAGARIDYTVGTEYRRLQGPVGERGNYLGFFFSVGLPFFDRNQGEIARAHEERRQVDLQLRALRAELEAEILAVQRLHGAAVEIVENLEGEMLGDARRVRDTMEYSYRRGEARLVEFLDAQRAYNDIMEGYHEARADLAKILYQIDNISAVRITP